MGSMNRRIKNLEDDDEGKFVRFRLPDGRIRTIGREELGLVEFAIAVTQSYDGEVDISDPDNEAVMFGTRIDAAGRPLT
jgi:hypothetical protein